MRIVAIFIASLLIAIGLTGVALVGGDDVLQREPVHRGPAATQQGSETLVLEAERSFSGSTTFVPSVLPSGTESLAVLATWSEAAQSTHDFLALWVTTAASREPVEVGRLEAFVPLVIPVDATTVDRPEQQRSAWTFTIRPVHTTPIGIFHADMEFQVMARGDAERSFSPKGSAPETLIDTAGAIVWGNAEFHNDTTDGFGTARASERFHLPDGARIDGDTIVVRLELSAHPDVLGDFRLAFRDAARTGWHWRSADAVQGNVLTFVIDVAEDRKDASTIETGLWEFQIRSVDQMSWQRDEFQTGAGYVVADYALTVTQADA